MKTNEKLAAYRKTLDRRMWIFRAAWLVYLILLVTRRFFGPAVTDSSCYSILMGGVTGALLVMTVMLLRSRQALRDEAAMQRLYNEEHDERLAAIRAKAGYPIVVVFGVALIGAAMVASFFNETVTLTLTAVALAEMVVCCMLKGWYSRRM